MKFKAYLLNEQATRRKYGEPRSKEISKEELDKLLETKCKKAYSAYQNKNATIFRGIRGKPDFLLTDPTKGEPRLSANTRNYMTLLVDNLQSWKKYPKRSKSLICATNYDYAKNYGDGSAYVVLPFDNAKIGVCSKQDFWLSFENLIDVSSFNDDINTIISDIINSNLNLIRPKNMETSWEALKKALEMIPEHYSDLDDTISYLYCELWLKLIEAVQPKDIINFLNRELSPENNDFKLKKPGDPLPDRNEVWVGNAPCVLVLKE